VSNEDLGKDGNASAEVKKEIRRIYLETLNAKMSAGSVHVYLLHPNGRPVGSQHVAQASKVEELTTLLENTIAQLKVPVGETLVPAAPQSACPKCAPGGLVLHLVARNVTRKNGQDEIHRPVLGETRSGNWGAYPAEDWIVLSKAECARLLPGAPIRTGTSWQPDKEVAGRILKHCYPSSENNDIATNRIDRQELTGTVLSVKDGIARARLEGKLRMKHPFYHRDDGNFVDASLLGFVEFEVGSGRIVTWQLVTTEATYGRIRFGVALRNVGSGG
jgi:hypothetical protein